MSKKLNVKVLLLSQFKDNNFADEKFEILSFIKLFSFIRL